MSVITISQRKEKVLPMIGYYEEKKIFTFYQKLIQFMRWVESLFRFAKRPG